MKEEKANVTFYVELEPVVIECLKALAETGRYGSTIEGVASALVEEGARMDAKQVLLACLTDLPKLLKDLHDHIEKFDAPPFEAVARWMRIHQEFTEACAALVKG